MIYMPLRPLPLRYNFIFRETQWYVLQRPAPSLVREGVGDCGEVREG